MTYDPDRFAHEQHIDVWIDFEMIGKKYNSDAMILDATWADDDSIALLMVEEDEDHPSLPFVLTVIHLDHALDVRHDLPERYDTLRAAAIAFEDTFR